MQLGIRYCTQEELYSSSVGLFCFVPFRPLLSPVYPMFPLLAGSVLKRAGIVLKRGARISGNARSGELGVAGIYIVLGFLVKVLLVGLNKSMHLCFSSIGLFLYSVARGF